MKLRKNRNDVERRQRTALERRMNDVELYEKLISDDTKNSFILYGKTVTKEDLKSKFKIAYKEIDILKKKLGHDK